MPLLESEFVLVIFAKSGVLRGKHILYKNSIAQSGSNVTLLLCHFMYCTTKNIFFLTTKSLLYRSFTQVIKIVNLKS